MKIDTLKRIVGNLSVEQKIQLLSLLDLNSISQPVVDDLSKWLDDVLLDPAIGNAVIKYLKSII